jgi:hypothetical protein
MRTGPASGNPTTLWAPTGCTLGEPRFDPAGAIVSIEIGGVGCSAGSAGTLTLTVPATGTASAPSRMLGFAPLGLQWFVPRSVGPKVALAVPAVTGVSATATITATDADDAVGGLTRMCRLDAGAWKSCGATLTMTALAAGRHTLTARATDPSGQISADVPIVWVVDKTLPTTSLTAVSNPLLGTSLTLRWTGTDAGGSSVASYDIRDRYAASGGGFGAFNYPSTWQHRTSPSLTVGLSQGYIYCFSVRARDRVGNLGSWSSERCTMVAYDDRALAVSGPYRGTSTAAMYGTYTRTLAAGQTLSRTHQCPACGHRRRCLLDLRHGAGVAGRRQGRHPQHQPLHHDVAPSSMAVDAGGHPHGHCGSALVVVPACLRRWHRLPEVGERLDAPRSQGPRAGQRARWSRSASTPPKPQGRGLAHLRANRRSRPVRDTKT